MRAYRYPFALALALFAGACADDDGVTSPGGLSALSIAGAPAAMLAGDTVALTAYGTDVNGKPVDVGSVEWTSSDTTVAVMLPGGRLTARGHGAVQVRATSSRGAQANAAIAVSLTTPERRLAYAFAHDESTPATYHPMKAFAFNATGGDIRVSRTATGRYRVTFGRLARIDSTFRDVVLVTAYGSGGERCHIEDWGNAPNGLDLDALVGCFGGDGAPVDSRFTTLVVGARSLPGRHGFAAVAAGGPAASTAVPNAWSSSGQSVALDRSAAGSYLVHLNAPRTTWPENYFISTIGGAPDLCKVASWNQGEWASVVCYAANGALTDARFTLLMLEEGRPGKRFGFAWANDPTAPIGEAYAPPAAYQRSSAGQAARVTRMGVGEYAVEFPGLANGGTTAEIVQISPFGSGLTTCQLEGWTEDVAATLRVQVRCWNRASRAREDGQFTVLVLE